MFSGEVGFFGGSGEIFVQWKSTRELSISRCSESRSSQTESGECGCSGFVQVCQSLVGGLNFFGVGIIRNGDIDCVLKFHDAFNDVDATRPRLRMKSGAAALP